VKNIPYFVRLYEPYIVSAISGRAIIPAVTRSRYPAAVLVENEKDDILQFYKDGNHYYVLVRANPVVKYVETTTVLANPTEVLVKEVVVPFREVPLSEDGVVKFVVEDVDLKQENTKIGDWVKVKIAGAERELVVPVRYLPSFFVAFSIVSQQEFPNCVDALSRHIVPNESIADYARKICESVFRGIVKSCATIRALSAAGACIAISARRHGYPLTLGDLIRRLGVDERQINLAYRYIVKKLKLSTKDVAIDIESYIKRLAHEVVPNQKLADAVAEHAVNIYRAARKHGVTGKDPKGVAAACIYIAANMVGAGVTQKQLCKLAGVTEPTIRKRIRELRSVLTGAE